MRPRDGNLRNWFGVTTRFGVIGRVKRFTPIAGVAILATALRVLADPHATWRDYGGAPDSAQFSTLTQITRENVAKLQVACPASNVTCA
jgi:hypothetical protein